MRAAFFDTEALTFSISEIPKPGVPRGEVLLRVETAGICGSDLHLVRSGLYGGEEASGPQVLGHEFSAVIEQIGSGVQDPRLNVGTRVAVEPTVPCGKCELCRAGRENICPHHIFRGMPPYPGSFQEYTVMPPQNLFPVPEHLGPDETMMAEPLAIAVHTKRVAGITGGETVAVVGCGPLGLLTARVFDLAGADVVLAVEPIETRRNLGAGFGVRYTVAPDQRPEKTLSDLTSGRLADVVVECAGPPEALELAIRLVRPGGTLIYVGIHPGQMEIDFTLARRREMVWKWVRRTANAYPESIDLLAKGNIAVRRLITHRWPLEEISSAFEVAAAYGDGIMKGAIDVSDG